MSMNWASFLSALAGSALVQTAVVMAFRRWFGRIDRLEQELKDFRDREIAEVKQKMKEIYAAMREVTRDVDSVRREGVTRADCNAQLEKFFGQVKDLATVAERVDQARRETNLLFDRVTSVKTDVDRMIGRLENMKTPGNRSAKG